MSLSIGSPQHQHLTQKKDTSCVHCGAHFMANAGERFCCQGCQFVFELIQSHGLGQYYEVRDANPPQCALPAQISTATYDYCDDPQWITKLSPDGLRMGFYLEGLNCTACVWLLEKIGHFCSDAEMARVDLGSSTIEVVRRPEGSFAAIARTLDRFGYKPHPLRDSQTSHTLRVREQRRDLIRLGVAGALTGNIMILSVSLYGGASGVLAEHFRWLAAALAFPVLTYCAWPFYRSTLAALRARHLNIDVPIVAALVAGVVASLWALMQNSEHVYFDSLTMLVFLLLASRFALKAMQRRQLPSTHLEDEFLLSTVERETEPGQTEPVSSLNLQVGDRVWFKKPAMIPIDGQVELGRAMIDASVLTGESEPLAVSHESLVAAGSRHLFGEICVRVVKPPRETRLANILRDTEQSARTKSAFVHFSDQVSRWFVAIVFTLALILVAVFLTTHPEEGIARALALVIVTCPCVFGLAIPLSMSLTVREAARRGIIIKNADAIEQLWKIKNLLFDKTGTLTTAEMTVLDMKYSDHNDLAWALALEKDQLHPVGRAIAKHLSTLDLPKRSFEKIEPCPGGGLQGLCQGTLYALKPLAPPQSCDRGSDTLGLYGQYGLFCADQPIARFSLGDRIRPEAQSLLQWARKHGLQTHLLSGDRREVVQRCAHLLKFSPQQILAEASPEDKLQRIRELAAPSAMIGDGANDAPALAAASVGVAVCGSLDVSLRSADVYLTRKSLTTIEELISMARLTRTAIFRNLIFSASFNLLSGSLAIIGFMTPLWAAVLMPISSLTVLLSSLWTGQQMRKIVREP